MNSFLFNVMLILLSSVSITQFCAASFPDYTAMSDISLIFSVQIRYLVFFVYFYKYHVFEYALFGFFIISTIYLLCRPNDINTVEKLVTIF
jgi:LMBR1 domain-containing protein 1